ncbi:MAG: nucleoside hydrolase, partial [Anaerolineae bacterium]|nr:nucleoside hydrolase [Anaerolineae bacterium]
MEKRKIILDCDPGHDDAIAIMLAARNPLIDLLGITVVAGNQTLDKTVVNALNVCQYLGIDVPV